jgi:hypothetical protein
VRDEVEAVLSFVALALVLVLLLPTKRAIGLALVISEGSCGVVPVSKG